MLVELPAEPVDEVGEEAHGAASLDGGPPAQTSSAIASARSSEPSSAAVPTTAPDGAGRPEGAQVVEGGDPARGEHRAAGADHPPHQLDVRSDRAPRPGAPT